MNYPPVLTKRDFVKRFNEGEFGNRGPMWNTFEEWLNEVNVPTSKKYHLRNRVAGGTTHYNMSSLEITWNWGTMPSQDLWYVSEMAPTEKTLIQGELMQHETRAQYLYYSQVAKPMREALKESHSHCYGVRVSQLLQHYMDPASWEWVNILLERYPEHVIEFSVYSVCWGTIPNRNTVIWECRKY